MRRACSIGFVCLLGLGAVAGIRADDTSSAEKQKIEALIKHVEGLEGATFVRNDTDYDPKTAAQFMRSKWNANVAQAKTASDFIKNIASMSSTSGKPYLIRLKVGKEVKLGDYLLAQLQQIEKPAAKNEDPKKSDRVFEIRTYTAADGKLDGLLARFRNHTCKLFEKHGMTNIGYWVPGDEPRSKDTLIYLLAHESRDAAKKSWDGFRSDPEWIKARTESEVNGRLTTKVESVFVSPTDFSKLK